MQNRGLFRGGNFQSVPQNSPTFVVFSIVLNIFLFYNFSKSYYPVIRKIKKKFSPCLFENSLKNAIPGQNFA